MNSTTSSFPTVTLTVDQAYQQAITFHQIGKLQDAERLYRAILQYFPHHSDAYHNLGILFYDTNRLAEAEAAFHRALELKSDFADVHNNLGSLLQNTNRLPEAESAYLRALELKPDFVEALNNLGSLLQDTNRLPEAESAYRRALEFKPDSPETIYNLGTLLKKINRLSEAEAAYRRAIDLKPDFVEAQNNLGSLLHETNRITEAEAAYHRVLELSPGLVEAHNNLGSLFYDTNRLPEAEAAYRRALDLKPDYAEAHCNLAFALLKQGDMKVGWEEYEWRWATPQMAGARRDFVQPQWRGEEVNGQTLLIHLEGGFGDTLQFCRYANLAAARGLRVILWVQPQLVRLLQSLPGIDRVVGADEELPCFDLHCSMLSLPLAFGTNLATIPSTLSYLRADKAQTEVWHARLATLPNKGLRIGLAWAGNPRASFSRLAAVDRRHSINPELLAPLLNLSGFHFFSLQKDRAEIPESFLLTDFMGEMEDFADTAALIENLDLVISVDTAVAHLAAAMGKPVWVLDRFDSCWRWLHDHEDSPWYPSLRLFRQPQPGDWQAVIEQVLEALSKLLHENTLRV